MNELELPALDGANPLGFLAALGTLVSTTESGENAARLYWKGGARWRPVLSDLRAAGSLCHNLAIDLRGRDVASSAENARANSKKEYETKATRLKKAKEDFTKRGLRGNERKMTFAIEINPLLEEVRSARARFLEKLGLAVPRPELSIGKKIDMSAEEFRAKARQFLHQETPALPAITMLAALAVEVNSGERTARTEFDFVDSSGRLAFLETVLQLMKLATSERLHDALFTPWKRADERWSLRFDPAEDRRYALLDRDPTAGDNKSRSEWMANLLAYRALALFPCAITRNRATTSGWSTTTDKPSFTWPIWKSPLRLDSVRSLLGQSALLERDVPRSVRLLGVGAVFRSYKISNGDYLNFSPSEAVL